MVRFVATVAMFAVMCCHAPVHAAALDPVRLQLKWQHQFQFAGYYAALEKGFYREAGLDVQILPSQPDDDPVQRVLRGEAEFGVGTTDLLLLREKGAPVVALAVIFQHSPLALLVRRQTGVETLHDLAGRKLMIEPGSAELFAYLRREGLTGERFTLLPHDFHVADLANGKVDGMSVYVSDEPFELFQSKVEYLLYSPRAAGIDFYGDNLFTTAAEIKSHPERVKAFRAASLKGWDYAMRHPEEIVQLIHARYGQRHSLDHLRFEAARMVPLLQTALVEVGHMNPGRWHHIAEVYAEQGMMKPGFEIKGFLYDPHPPPPDFTWLYLSLAGVAAMALVFGGAALYVHRVNRRLQSSEKRYRVVYETAPVAFIVSDREHAITDWNNAAQAIFGWSRDEALGRNLFDLLVPDSDSPRMKEVVDATLGQPMPTHNLNRNLTKNGETLLCEWSHALHHDDDGNVVGVLSLGVNVTERKKLEDGLMRAKNIAEQSLEEHRQLLAMVSHEFRTPLAIIESAAQVLELHCGTAEPGIDRILRAVKRLSSFLDNCLIEERLDTHVLSRQGSGIDMPELLQAVAEQARQLSARHRVNLQLDGVSGNFDGDPQLLRLMLQNLLENAIKYSPDGGDVTLRAVGGQEHLVLVVEDHGLGIAAEETEKVFAKFYRGQRVGRIPGAGLGLYLARRIATLHDGDIGVDSQPGRGTRVSVRLRRALLPQAGEGRDEET